MKENDIRETPRSLFDSLNERFRFTLDACATHQNALCKTYYTEENSGLTHPWQHGTWVNPPFSELNAWLRKAWAERAVGWTPIVMLVPANRTDQPWWQNHVAPHIRNPNFTVVWLDHRTLFTVNGGQPILNKKGKIGSPSFACALLIWT